ncbi:DUF5694 domain-containing protein [Rossellomorea aquimaris]|uniref:DUF5694 domain-containing protein n=1 Tax=Rossellomorea aquimaris TaxID=189382 RepID=UPI001CD56169|nr:DUF5694 domain-containing protein [Rossellomorea aquimaris]MCA1055771.1 DUF5694 domain-containing protein [Rossellomorea aquimaris]
MQKSNEIILVGTFHFLQGGDLIAEKQRELEDLVERIAVYQPTKVALEWNHDDHGTLNKQYMAKGNGADHLHEIHQIGFRLGHRMQHDRVYAVNWEGQLTGEHVESLYGAMQEFPDVVRRMESIQNHQPEVREGIHILESYTKLNDEKFIEKLEALYLSFVRVTQEDQEPGMDFLKRWMERELRIFKNVLDIADGEGERIFLLIGNDHVWMLRNLFKGAGWNVINPFGEYT